MPAMKRFHVEGHIYYITTNIYKRLPIFTHPSFIIPLYDSLHFYRHQYAFRLLGYVIMPDHIHLMLWPTSEVSVSDFMRDFKTFTAKRIIRQAQVEQNQPWPAHFSQSGQETGRGENKVWQDSYWDVNVFSNQFVRQKLNYIHRNPLRSGLVTKPEDYPYSSYRNYVLDEEWWLEIDRGWS